MQINIAQSRAKHEKTENFCSKHRPRLPCPICEFKRLIDTGQHTLSRTLVAGESDYPNADYYQKCPCCKAEIGIQKLNNPIFT